LWIAVVINATRSGRSVTAIGDRVGSDHKLLRLASAQLARYKVDVEIKVKEKTIFSTPSI
jgi:hypothetical protein